MLLPELYIHILSFCDARTSVFMSRVCKQFYLLVNTYTPEIIEKIRQEQSLDYIISSFQDLDYVSTTMKARKGIVNISFGNLSRRFIPDRKICPLFQALQEKKCILNFLEDNHHCDMCKTEEDLFHEASAINLCPLLAYYQSDTLKVVKLARYYISHYNIVNLDILLQYLIPRQFWTDMMLLVLLFKCAEADSYECYKVIDNHFKYGSLDILYAGVCLYMLRKEGDFHRPLHSLYNLGYNGKNISLFLRFCLWCIENKIKEVERMISCFDY